MTQEQIKQAAHEYFRKGQLGFVKSGSEAGFIEGANLRQEEIDELVQALKNLFDNGCITNCSEKVEAKKILDKYL